MSFVFAAPDLLQGAAQDLAGIHASLAEAAAAVAAPTMAIAPAAADEVSAAISALFGNFGQEFQVLNAQAQAFHAEFVGLMNAGAGAYLSAELANAQQVVANAIGGGGSTAAATSSAGGGLLGGLLGGGGSSGVGGLLGGLTGGTSGVGGLLGGLTGGTSGVTGLLGGLTGGTGGLGGLLGGLTGGTSVVTGLLGGLTGGTGGLGGLLGGLLGGTGGLGGLLGGLTGGTSGLGGLTSLGTSLCNELHLIEQAVLNELQSIQHAVVTAIGGSAAAAAAMPAAGGLLGGLLGGSGGVGGLVGSLTGSSGVGGLVGSLTGAASGLDGLLGGLTGGTSGLGGLLGGLGNLGSLGGELNSLLSGVVPGLPGGLSGLENSLTGEINSLLPGLLQLQLGGTGTGFTGILGPYQALVANTTSNTQSLIGGWFADPYPFLRQVGVNWTHYGQIIATGLETGNLAPISAIPGDIAHNLGNVGAVLTDISLTPELGLTLLPTSLTLNTFIGLPLVAGIDLIGAPVATAEAGISSFVAFTTALATGNVGGAIVAAVDAPAVILNGLLNGQATIPIGLSLANLPVAGPILGGLVNANIDLSLPLDGLLVPPGGYLATVTLTSALTPVLPPITLQVGVGGTPLSGLGPFLVNYAPQQLAQAIGAPASPPPLIDISLFTLGTNGLTGLLGGIPGITGDLGGLLGGLTGGTSGLGGLLGGLL